MVTLADREPVAVGVNVTLTVQLAPAATLVPQVFVCAKSPGFVPVIEIPLIVSLFPRLVSVKLCVLLVVPTLRLTKVSELRESDTAVFPVPFSLTVWLPVLASSAMVKVALIEPVVEGVNVTVNVHKSPTPRVLPQLLFWVKAELFAPVMAMLEMSSVAVPVLVSVTVCGVLLVPTTWVPKYKDEADRVAPGLVVPVPVRLTV